MRRSAPWMVFAMHLTQTFTRQVGVNLRCCNINVAEHGLHGAQVGSPFEEMGCKRMSQGMRIERSSFGTLLGALFYNEPERLTGEWFS